MVTYWFHLSKWAVFIENATDFVCGLFVKGGYSETYFERSVGLDKLIRFVQLTQIMSNHHVT